VGRNSRFTPEYYKQELLWNLNDTHGIGIVLLAGIEVIEADEAPGKLNGFPDPSAARRLGRLVHSGKTRGGNARPDPRSRAACPPSKPRPRVCAP